MFSLSKQIYNKNNMTFIQLMSFFIFFLFSFQATAQFSLESNSVILEESDGRVDFNITNTSSSPILLISKLHDLDANSFSKQIIISPPIARINANKTQKISFVLKKAAKIPHEVLMKVSFEGVGQAKKNTQKMVIKQEIGFLITTSSLKSNKTPWGGLKLTITANKLVISNPSQNVVRMDNNIKLFPGNESVALKNPYILPSETFSFDIKGSYTSVKIRPLSSFGFLLPEMTLPIE